MNCIDFRIIKDGKDTGKLVGIFCNKTVSVDLIAGMHESYPASDGYELVLDKVFDQTIEEKDNFHISRE